MGGEGRASVHDTTYDPLVEQNRCQVGPTILFECPAQIPRSSLRSFSLWATPVPLSALAGLKMRIDRFYSMRGLQTCLYNTM